jgi:hypothetical protein
MENKIVYKYEHRSDIDEKLCLELLGKLYSVSYPTTESNDFLTLSKDADKKSHGKWNWPVDFYYVPQDVYKAIVDDFLYAHRFSCSWKEDMEFLIGILFEKGGLNEVYGPTEWSKEPLRHCEDVPTIDKIIPQESVDKLKEVLENYKRTYQFGERDYNGMLFSTFNYGPSSSKEHVVQAWKEVFGKDIEIPDDSTWVDEYYIDDEDEYYDDDEIEELNDEENPSVD